jgi:two-component system response regulator YesN
VYKVVIIDDESIIVEGLNRVVDWNKFRCQVVATGHDAVSGAAAIRAYKPNIVFTDIKMPNEDGLTMLAGLKSEFPDMLVTVLTGYRDFEYAKEAISLGVTRFLLKPSKMDELEEALTCMTGVLDRQRPREAPTAGDSANSFLARQACGYMRDHYAEKISLQDVADHCYVSQWHLSKLLHKHLGEAFYDLLNGIRVERAKVLLEDPSLRISEIAAIVGYADTAHFSRIFKKCVGLAAGDYRNAHCGGK